MEYTVKLTEEAWTRLLNCAALAPFGQVAQLITDVSNQIMQQKAQEKPKEPS